MKQKGSFWDQLIGSSLFSCLLMLLTRIPLSRIIGDMGMGYVSIGIEIVTVFSIGLSYGMARAVAGLIKYYVRRDLLHQARTAYRKSVLLILGITIPLSAGMIIFSQQAAKMLTGEYLGYMALAAAAPMICFSGLTGVMRGYFQGVGRTAYAMNSRLLEGVMAAVAIPITALLMYRYGEKVAALLKYPGYAAAYGAMGACFGLTLAGAVCVICLLVLCVTDRIQAAHGQKPEQTGGPRERSVRVLPVLIGTGLPYAVCGVIYNLHFLVDQRIFYRMMEGKEASGPVFWGIYYGKYSTLTGIAGVLCAMAGWKGMREVVKYYERQDTDMARRRLRRTVHGVSLISIPVAVLIAVLAEPVSALFFTGTQKTAVELLRCGSGAVVLFAFAYLFMGILLRLRKTYLTVAVAAGSFLVHLLILYLLLRGKQQGVQAVVWSMMVFWFLNAAAGLLLIRKYIGYRPRWIKSVLFPLAAAVAAGVVSLLLSQLLAGVAGNLVVLLLSLSVGVIVYYFMLILLDRITIRK